MRTTVERLKQLAMDEGFLELRLTAAVDAGGFSNLLQWLDAGYAGQMDYFQNRIDAYRHPRGVLKSVRTLAVLAYPYPAAPPYESREGFGKTARYTWIGQDYHDLIHEKLKILARCLTNLHSECTVRGIVDTAPLLEREFAELSGIGWCAKNTLVINKYAGSYFFLACLLTDLELPVDEPHAADHCGTCRRCLDACPTAAFPQPGVLDATRCISYLTIEHRGVIPEELRSGIGDWLFGCDICQEVCPWNQSERLLRLGRRPVESDLPKAAQLELSDLFELNEDDFRIQFKKSPMWRAKRRGLLRNAAIVLGNAGSESAISCLEKGLADSEPLVRGASVWALRKIGGARAENLLRRHRISELDPTVLSEFGSDFDQNG